MTYKIYINHYLCNEVILSLQLIKKNKINVSDTIIVKAGARQKSVKLSFKNNLEEECIELSPDLEKFFLLPLDVPYEVRFIDGELHIGPVIGLMLVKKTKDLTDKFLRMCTAYALNYENINGLIYVFSGEHIDTEKKIITGYYYKPHSSSEKGVWKKAVFAYPDVIFRRTSMPREIYKHLASEMGDKIFNYPWFDKWKMAQWLEKDSLLAKYLPKTRLVHSEQDLDEMLGHYQMVFLKPTYSGSYGNGIITVTRKKEGDYFRFRDKPEEKVLKSKEEMALQINEIVAKRKYIVQPGIPVLTYEGRKIVFRVIMQKDGSRKWQCTGIVALLGQVNGLDSHSPENGIQMSFKEVLESLGKLTAKEIEKIKKEMVAISKESCSVIDRHGHYGDVGIDIVLDKSYKPWFIEINVLRHNHRVPLFIKDNHMYRTMKTRILDYAKSLTEFY